MIFGINQKKKMRVKIKVYNICVDDRINWRAKQLL